MMESMKNTMSKSVLTVTLPICSVSTRSSTCTTVLSMTLPLSPALHAKKATTSLITCVVSKATSVTHPMDSSSAKPSPVNRTTVSTTIWTLPHALSVTLDTHSPMVYVVPKTPAWTST